MMSFVATIGGRARTGIRGALFAMSIVTCVAVAAAESRTFEYLGEVEIGDRPYSGTLDLRLRIFDGPDPSRSIEVALPTERRGVVVSDGRFRVELDLEAIGARETWVEVAIAEPGSDAFRTLGRRDLLESAEIELLATPAGAVVLFDLPACPSGWTEHVAARGRTLVGLNSGGTLGGTVGLELFDLQSPGHSHSIPSGASTALAGAHNHQWSRLTSVNDWVTFTVSGAQIVLVYWNDGVGSEGAGYFPIGTGTPGPQDFFTDNEAAHNHELGGITVSSTAAGMPFVQLLACRKV